MEETGEQCTVVFALIVMEPAMSVCAAGGGGVAIFPPLLARVRICKRFRNSGIDSKESIRRGLCNLAGRYDI
jgi:hypothetical protein